MQANDTAILNADGPVPPVEEEPLWSEEELQVDPAADTPIDDTDEDDDPSTEEDTPTPTGAEPPKETPEQGVQRVLQNLGIDPATATPTELKLAKRVYDQEVFVNRQGNELGELRKKVGTAPDTTATPPTTDDTPATTPLAEIPQTPTGVTVFKDEELIPDRFYIDPKEWEHDEDGYPVDETSGQSFAPLNPYGVEYIPEPAWTARLEKLAQDPKYKGNQLLAYDEWQREKAAHMEQVNAQSVQSFQATRTRQVQVVTSKTDEVAANLGNYFPEAVAKELAATFVKEVPQLADKLIQTGRVSPFEFLRTDYLVQLLNKYAAQSLINGEAAKLAKEIEARQVTGRTPNGTGVRRVPQQGNQQRSGAAPTGAGRKAEEVDYTSKDFKFVD